VQVGVRPGTLFFDGITDGHQYSGTAYVFSLRCPPTGFPVAGPVSPDGRQVVMYGASPIINASTCQIMGYHNYNDTLAFNFVSAPAPALIPVQPVQPVRQQEAQRQEAIRQQALRDEQAREQQRRRQDEAQRQKAEKEAQDNLPVKRVLGIYSAFVALKRCYDPSVDYSVPRYADPYEMKRAENAVATLVDKAVAEDPSINTNEQWKKANESVASIAVMDPFRCNQLLEVVTSQSTMPPRTPALPPKPEK
jgi:hypothetical protein